VSRRAGRLATEGGQGRAVRRERQHGWTREPQLERRGRDVEGHHPRAGDPLQAGQAPALDVLAQVQERLPRSGVRISGRPWPQAFRGGAVQQVDARGLAPDVEPEDVALDLEQDGLRAGRAHPPDLAAPDERLDLGQQTVEGDRVHRGGPRGTFRPG
jgi:hypothetical protein